jgi:hypothetical protein
MFSLLEVGCGGWAAFVNAAPVIPARVGAIHRITRHHAKLIVTLCIPLAADNPTLSIAGSSTDHDPAS